MISGYLKFDVVTKIEAIEEQPSPFPSISICSVSKSFDNISLNSIILSCSFNDDNECKANPENFFEMFQGPKYGVCYKFNSGKNLSNDSIPIRRIYLGGYSHGFLLTVKENHSLLINIHNHSLSPFPNEKNNNYNENNM